MQITFDTKDLSELDLKVLRALTGDAPAVVSEPALADASPTRTSGGSTAAKAPAKPKPAPAPKPAPEPEPEEDEAEDEDLLGTEEPVKESGPTIEDATAMATKLMADGETAKVKAALTAVGVKRVSELTTKAKIAKFVSELED